MKRDPIWVILGLFALVMLAVLLASCKPTGELRTVAVFGGLTSASPVGYGTKRLADAIDGSGYAPCITPVDCEITAATLERFVRDGLTKDRPVILIGHSYGVVKALRFAAELCEEGYRVAYLALFDGPYLPDPGDCVEEVDNFIPAFGGFGVEYESEHGVFTNHVIKGVSHISISADPGVSSRVLEKVDAYPFEEQK